MIDQYLLKTSSCFTCWDYLKMEKIMMRPPGPQGAAGGLEWTSMHWLPLPLPLDSLPERWIPGNLKELEQHVTLSCIMRRHRVHKEGGISFAPLAIENTFVKLRKDLEEPPKLTLLTVTLEFETNWYLTMYIYFHPYLRNAFQRILNIYKLCF